MRPNESFTSTTRKTVRVQKQCNRRIVQLDGQEMPSVHVLKQIYTRVHVDVMINKKKLKFLPVLMCCFASLVLRLRLHHLLQRPTEFQLAVHPGIVIKSFHTTN